MTDPSELIEMLRSGEWLGPNSRRHIADKLATIVAERDAALAAKPAAPTVETVRVRIGVFVDIEGVVDRVWIAESDFRFLKPEQRPTAYITADIPIPQPAEVIGTVEATPTSPAPAP